MVKKYIICPKCHRSIYTGKPVKFDSEKTSITKMFTCEVCGENIFCKPNENNTEYIITDYTHMKEIERQRLEKSIEDAKKEKTTASDVGWGILGIIYYLFTGVGGFVIVAAPIMIIVVTLLMAGI